MSLPEFRREQPGFESLFGVPPAAVIHSMDAAGHDIPEQRPAVRLPIGFVGLDRSHVPITIDDPFGGGAHSRVSCEITAGTTVPADRRPDDRIRIESRSLESIHGHDIVVELDV